MRAKFINEIIKGKNSGISSLNIGKEKIKTQIIDWLTRYNFSDKHYVINDNLSIDINGSVDLKFLYIQKFPEYIQFNKVYGSFYCNNCNLLSLRGCPSEVGGDFSCAHNPLKSLEYSPLYIGLDYNCSSCELNSLNGSPNEIDHNFNCSHNQLLSLVGGPSIVKNRYDCSNNMLNTLKGCPSTVFNLICNDNKLKNLDNGPEFILQALDISNNPLSITNEEIESKYKIMYHPYDDRFSGKIN